MDQGDESISDYGSFGCLSRKYSLDIPGRLLQVAGQPQRTSRDASLLTAVKKVKLQEQNIH